MPFYFAYGANLDRGAMVGRCPGARPIGPGRLMNHRFFIMRDGYASVRPARGEVVHGLLWHLAPADVAPLDAFEDVAAGLYTKTVRPVMKPVGSTQAFLYVGHTVEEGLPLPGYLETVAAAARAIGLPEPYLRALEAWGRKGSRGMPFTNTATEPAPQPGPVAGVRPRFATPFDRS